MIRNQAEMRCGVVGCRQLNRWQTDRREMHNFNQICSNCLRFRMTIILSAWFDWRPFTPRLLLRFGRFVSLFVCFSLWFHCLLYLKYHLLCGCGEYVCTVQSPFRSSKCIFDRNVWELMKRWMHSTCYCFTYFPPCFCCIRSLFLVFPSLCRVNLEMKRF